MYESTAFNNFWENDFNGAIWEGYKAEDIDKPEAVEAEPVEVVPMKRERMARFTTKRGYGVGVVVKEGNKTVKLRLKCGKEITVHRRKKNVEIFGPMVVLKPFNRKG